jgi:hypothetical protein
MFRRSIRIWAAIFWIGLVALLVIGGIEKLLQWLFR